MGIEDTVYPLSRYWCSGDFRFYYAYGNTPAQDFLQNCSHTKHPAILVLGCGDIRSCFYSLWKNFDVKGPARFDGVHFLLNDASAAVLARDILFLYLCIHLPQEESELKKWLSGFWAIWYCHELYPEHNELLNKSLRALCNYSNEWSSKDNPLYPLVKFSSPATLSEIGKVWNVWLQHKINVTSVKEMHSSRKDSFLKFESNQLDARAAAFVEHSTKIPCENITFPQKSDAQKSEVRSYMEKGSVYAERVFGLHLPITKTFVNFTFFEREDGLYTLHYRSLPFSCYFHAVDFKNEQFGTDVSNQFPVVDKFFKLWPLLANCVQQFSLWIQSAHKVLKSEHKDNVCFTFNCSHALSFCYELEIDNSSVFPKFDLIYSSNLIDHLSPPNLILSAIPLLKDNGLLFTSTFNILDFVSLDQYITTSFGFDSKLIPIILGIRCINHEGDNYASPVAVQPCPYTAKSTVGLVHHESLLIWEKLKPDTIPLVFSQEQQLPTAIFKALLSSVQAFVYSLMIPSNSPLMMSNLCVETAVKVIQVFISHISADFSPQFWKPLTDAMQATIKPYMHSMQTQLILHGIHMHLTVTEANCPVCLKVLISDHISLFSAKYFVPTSSTTPKFMALVHKEDLDDATFLCAAARNGGDVHIFDCVSPSLDSENGFLQLCFYAPLVLVEQKYKVTIVTCSINLIGNIAANIVDLSTQPLSSYQTVFSLFRFFQAAPSDVKFNSNPKSFGLITSHVSNGDSSDLKIDFHPAVTACLATEKLESRRVSSNTLELSFGECACQLKCPYPIVYDCIKIKLSRKKGSMIIHCPRAFQDFTLEQPLFIISPDKELSLFPLLMSQDAVASLSGQQFTKQEHNLIQSCGLDSAKLSPLTKVKVSMLYFFHREKHFFRLVLPNGDVGGLFLVNKWLFNYENRTPIIDLAFCFLEESSMGMVLPVWDSIPPQQIRSIELTETEHKLFKQVFHYFAGRTNGSCSSISNSKSLFNWLIERNIQQYFTRAVISFLLCIVDHFYDQYMLNFFQDLLDTAKPSDVINDKCDKCGKVSELLKKCSKCKEVKYCDEKCQRAHWKIHKSVCKKSESHKDVAVMKNKRDSTFRPFPIARYWYGGDFRYYYAYGNTVAEDFLENCLGVKEPQILSLGCGDIRSCFYTLWKHFDFSVSNQFDGIHFMLNDCSTPVQARNIVFLYLCVHLPSKGEERRHWLCAMWAIWYCHELHWKHKDVLDSSLRALLKYSDSVDQWSSAENPLGLLVRLTSPVVLDEISQIWRTWLERKVNVASVEQMNFSRLHELKRRGVFENLELYASSYSHSITFINGANPSANAYLSKQNEVIAYIQTGNCYAEKVLNLDLSSLPTTANLTLYERPDGVYNLHYGSMPFSGYYHTVEFSPAAMKSAGVKKSLCDVMLVRTQSFKSLPFLSNSVQQFTMWVQSANKVLTEGSRNQKFLFTFNNLDALAFCQDLHHNDGVKSEFDMIYTSNLMDHLSPPNLILSAITLLKETGLLFSSSLLYKNFTSNLDEYITTCFGFDLKLLPDILGVRCINHEGAGYANPVMIEPVPVHVGDMLKLKRHERMLIWQKVSAQSLVLSKLPQLESGNITDGIFDAFKVSIFSLLSESGEGQRILNNQCIETAVLVLQTFASSVNADFGNYQFWEPLSSVFHHKMKPYLNCLQSQLLLHKVHMHLTVGEEKCPMCNHDPIEEYLGLFCSEVPLPIPYATPNFLAFVHQYSSSDAHYLCKEAMSSKDVHIFDCIDGSVENGALKLRFFAPVKFVENNYSVTIALSQVLPETSMIISCLPTRNLQDAQIDFMHYSFSHITPLHQSISEESSFGKLIFHLGDGERMQSEISLSDSTFTAYAQHKLSTKKVSSDEVKLVCGEFHYHLKFKYPIDYNGISIKLSGVQKTVKIVSPRQAHDFAEEKPMFITLPDHQLSLPPQQVKDAIMICHSGMQMNKEERKILDACNRDHTRMTPLINVKETFMYFFQCKEHSFSFVSSQKKLHGTVIINQYLFDYRYRAPAIDLAFYFVHPSSVQSVLWAMRNVRTREIIVDDAESEVLHKALVYFAARTNGTCRTACKPNQFEQLQEHNVDQYFTRAVVYLLYGDPDICGMDMLKNIPSNISEAFHTPNVVPAGNPSTDQKCDYCSKYYPVTKKCTNCKKVQYCSKDCQTKHWQAHSKDCKKVPQSKDVEFDKSVKVNVPLSSSSEATISDKPVKQLKTLCSFCNKCSGTLKRCKQCGVAQYCDAECQVNHWQQHKLECKTLSRLGSSFAKHHSTTDDPTSLPLGSLSKCESCGFCGSCSAKLRSCTRCGKTKYCGKECQRKHWNDHKNNCL